ncbi:hypothetical protein AVEN_185528-1, partial [Araneus ventricosus]
MRLDETLTLHKSECSAVEGACHDFDQSLLGRDVYSSQTACIML